MKYKVLIRAQADEDSRPYEGDMEYDVSDALEALQKYAEEPYPGDHHYIIIVRSE